MPQHKPSIINIGLVGGGDFCKEILEKTTAVYEQAEMVAPILAVVFSRISLQKSPPPTSPMLMIEGCCCGIMKDSWQCTRRRCAPEVNDRYLDE